MKSSKKRNHHSRLLAFAAAAMLLVNNLPAISGTVYAAEDTFSVETEAVVNDEAAEVTAEAAAAEAAAEVTAEAAETVPEGNAEPAAESQEPATVEEQQPEGTAAPAAESAAEVIQETSPTETVVEDAAPAETEPAAAPAEETPAPAAPEAQPAAEPAAVPEAQPAETAVEQEAAAEEVEVKEEAKTEESVPIDVTVKITGKTLETRYNGAEQAVEGFTADVSDSTVSVELAEGHDAVARGTEVGTYMMDLAEDDFKVISEKDVNVTFEITDGKLVITEKIPTYYEADIEGFTITATTEEGAFTEPVKLVASVLASDSDEYKNAEQALEENGQSYDGMLALDIHFESKETEAEIEPVGKVSVSFAAKAASLTEIAPEAIDQESVQITHIKEVTEESPEVEQPEINPGDVITEVVADVAPETADITVEVTEEAVTEISAEFEVDSFSTFVITWGEAPNEQNVTVHWGELQGGEFVELQEDSEVTMDTTAETISLLNSFEGKLYAGAVYCTPGQTYEQGSSIESTLTKTANGWEGTVSVHNEDDTVTPTSTILKDGSNIYVTFTTSEGHEETPDDPDDEIATPTTTKTVHVNSDGSATITIDIAGDTVEEDESHYANVLVILDATRSMNGTKWTNAKAAMKALIETLTEGKNAGNAGKIDFALVTFGRSATVVQNWTKDNATFKTTCAGINMVTTSGTNWEAGMRGGLYGVLNNMPDDDPTYVIFLTDGDPNVYYSSGADTNYSNTGTTNGYNQNANTSANHSADEAKAIAAKTKLYGIYCGDSGTTPSGESFNRLVGVINGEGQGGQKTIAANADTIESEFKAIAETMLKDMSPTDVSVDDGIPSLASISANVSGTPGGYDYYISNDGGTTFTEWADAPGATYSSDNGVTWDLSEEKKLEKDTVCRIVFTVWPSQEAYDIVANLNNGTVKYEDLDPAVQDQIGSTEGGAPYYLKTNTHLNTTYTFKDKTYTDSPEKLPQGEMPLKSSTMTVEKKFAHSINEQDEYKSVDFYLMVDGKYYQQDGTTSATLDESKVYTLHVASPTWTNSIYIAPGVMKGTEVLESGHKYTLEEKVLEGREYEYEFTPQTVRPMVIDGTLTFLVLEDKYNTNPDPEHIPEYTIDDETYYVASENNGTLVGTNRKTAELDITKLVEDKTGKKTEAQLDNETFTYRVTLTVPVDADVSGITAFEYVPRTGEGRFTIFGYQSSEEDSTKALPADVERFSGKTFGAFTVTTPGGGNTLEHVFVTSGDTKTAVIDITLKRNEILRFTNLPTGTQYTIEEVYANLRQSDPSRNADAVPSTDVPSNLKDQGYSVTIATKNGDPTVSGTKVSGTIEDLDVRYYNQFTNTLDSVVDAELQVTKHLDGYQWNGERYYFTLAAGKAEYADGTTGTSPMPAPTNPNPIFLSNASGSADKSYAFGSIRFGKAGTYTYTITESVNAEYWRTDGLTTDDLALGGPVTVTVTVEADADGKLSVMNISGTDVTYTAADPTTGTIASGNTKITNSLKTTEATIIKVWNDAKDQDGKRPAELKMTLTKPGDGGAAVVVAEETLSDANKWTVTVGGLQATAGGKAIEYTWSESQLPAGYTMTGNSKVGTVTTITNSYTPEKTEATVQKVWDDADDQDGKRPKALTVTLSNGDQRVLNAENGWTATITGLPKYDKGQEIKYTWSESQLPAGYTMTGNATEGTVTTITNTHTPETTEATVRKVWNDADNRDGKRPASLVVTLSNGTEVTLNEANGWQAKVEKLPKYAKGVEIEYTWKEGSMPEGYDLTGTSKDGTITTFTNSYEPKETEASVKKVWDDADDQDGIRPESLTVVLSNGTEVTLNEANGWEAKVEHLPMYDGGKKIEYTWSEKDLPAGYTLSSTTVEGTITTLTNTHTPEETEASVRKVWDDANNQDGKRPATLVVTLSNGTDYELNEANGWEAKAEKLPKYDKGVEIEYTWKEGNMPEGYSLTNSSKSGTVTTLTNSYTPEKIDVRGRKIWDDADNADGVRPESITVNLLANGVAVRSTTVTGGSWEFEFAGLPRYENGRQITYTISENAVPGYTTYISGYTITNTHTYTPPTPPTPPDPPTPPVVPPNPPIIPFDPGPVPVPQQVLGATRVLGAQRGVLGAQRGVLGANRTGDDGRMWTWFAVMAAGAAVLLVYEVISVRKRKGSRR